MPNIKLIVEYEGTAYAGWQRQPHHPTVQAAIEDAILRVTQEHIPAIGAGRTDSGVHALGQVVSFQTKKDLVDSQWASALNSLLPKDISVVSSVKVPDDFHARFSAKGKIYEYRMILQPSRPAIDRHRAWYFPYQLDMDAIHQAIPYFLGTHDFTSFRGQRSQTLNPICTISHLSVSFESPSLLFRIEGDRFLKQMVRAIVGTLVEVGQHKHNANTMTDILESKDRKAAGRTAPPHGLFLVKVLYS